MPQDREQDQKNAPSHKDEQDQRTGRPGQQDQGNPDENDRQKKPDDGQNQRR